MRSFPASLKNIVGSRRGRVSAVAVTVAAAGLLVVPLLALRLSTAGDVVDRKSAPRRPVALILGAGLWPDGTPTPVLEARIETGVQLYYDGKVTKLLMSGDNSRSSYDEVSAMKRLAVARGVEPDDVLLDFAGFRTLDSCVRVRKVYGQTAILVVSQRFHLPRAVHLCRWAGLDATGVIAPDPRGTRSRLRSWIRELPAATQALADAHVLDRQPKFLGDPIDIDNPPSDALANPLDTTP